MNTLTLSTTLAETVFHPIPGEWVQLRNPLSPYSDDEALLQYEYENGVWLAWIPSYGLCHIDRSQFVSRSVKNKAYCVEA